MSVLTSPFFDVMSTDAALALLLNVYNGEPAVFTIDPVPGDAVYPLIVTSGEVVRTPNEAKNCRGFFVIRDIRCYTEANGSAAVVEDMAARVYALFHRVPLSIPGYNWIMSDVGGPIEANVNDYYGRILSVSVIARRLSFGGS